MNLMLTEQMEDTITESPDKSLYNHINHHSNPLMLLGIQISHMFDHVRTKIDERYEPIRVFVGEKYFYGVKLQPSDRFFNSQTNRLKTLINTPVGVDRVKSIDIYKKRVNMLGLSCDDCWAQLDNNIFPIDANNLNTMTINSNMLKPEKLFVTDDESLPWFVQHAEPKIYIQRKKE